MDWMNPFGSFQDFSKFGTAEYAPSAAPSQAKAKKRNAWSWGGEDEIDPNAGSEQNRIGTAIQGGAGIIQGLFDDSEEEDRNKQDVAYKNAQLMQQYQNNLPNMLAARQQSRQRASGLASLAGLY